MRASGKHSFLDLHEKSRLALTDSRVITIAVKADSPTSAENTAKRQKFGKAKRLAASALVRLRIYHLEDFWELPEIIENFYRLSMIEQNHILAKLPENIRTALEAKREGLKNER